MSSKSFKRVTFLVVFRFPDEGPQEIEFNTKEAAEDYKKTVEALGGIALIQKQERE